jgi:hypothetical protein
VILALESFVHRGAGHGADRIGYGALPFVGGVLVDQCGASRARAHALHLLAQRCACFATGQVVAGVTQIVGMPTSA